MTYKLIPWNDKFSKKMLANSETRAIYEATKLQIDLSLKLKKARFKLGLVPIKNANLHEDTREK